jgi:NAD+ synthetase
MKIALAQVNPLVGDIDANTALVASIADKAASMGADLVVLPEMVITGYPPLDLLERPELSERSIRAVEKLAASTAGGPALLVGHPAINTTARGRPFVNSTVLLAQGAVAASYAKRLLPSYDVFDEDRWFEPGTTAGVMQHQGTLLGLAVCEDIWHDSPMLHRRSYGIDPIAQIVESPVRMILNPSASPYERGKPAQRESMLASVARNNGVAVIFVNQVGGNDSLVFDGGSLAIDARGRTCARLPLFEEALAIVEVDQSGHVDGRQAGWPADPREEMFGALSLGLRDYVTKCGHDSVVLGLSGGIDSALVATIAAETLGPERVHAISMPSRFSSKGSVDDAKQLAGNLGIKLTTLPIEGVYSSLLSTLAPVFGDRPFDLAEENLQARARGALLMGVSNKLGGLVLATGNKSELAVGYCTLYGDMVGALAPIGDVLKTDVFALARWLNRENERIPVAIIDKPPSAELRPDQKDEDSLPPYDLLDRVLAMYLEKDMHIDEIVATGIPESQAIAIIEMVRRAEYKRIQAPLTLKVSPRAFGTGRRYPVAQGFGR